GRRYATSRVACAPYSATRREGTVMSLHPAYDALFGKHRIRFFADKRQWKDNCLECGGKDTLFVRYDDDVAEFRCDACGRNGSERLRPPSAPTDGGNGAPPRVDAEYQRPLEEAQRALDA